MQRQAIFQSDLFPGERRHFDCAQRASYVQHPVLGFAAARWQCYRGPQHEPKECATHLLFVYHVIPHYAAIALSNTMYSEAEINHFFLGVPGSSGCEFFPLYHPLVPEPPDQVRGLRVYYPEETH